MNKEELKSKIIKANAAYRSGTAIMSDQTFDDLCEAYQKLVPADEYEKFRDSLHEGKGKVKHPFIMGSLDKLKAEDPAEVKKFVDSCSQLNVSAKIDGISCRLHYEDGKLISASTRGNGEYGEDITDKIKFVKCVPQVLGTGKFGDEYKEIDIRGELVILKKDFEMMDGFANPRNAVAGIMNRKDWKEEDVKNVTFVAYTILGDKFTKEAQFAYLAAWSGFSVAWNKEFLISDTRNKSADELTAMLFELASQEFEYETDGLVICDSNYRNEAKYRPDNCKAFKINQQKAIAKLIDIEWSGPSKLGTFCPVAILEPVELGGVVISKATLHNVDFINKMNIDFGDEVELVRSGDVIPKILSVAKKHNSASSKYSCIEEMCTSRWDAPAECPCCGSKLEVDGVDYCCKNPNCSDKLLRQTVDFIKRLGVKSVSEATLSKFNIHNIAELLTFHADPKYKSETKFANELLTKVFTRSKQELLAAMNFEDLGETLINKIVDFYGYNNIVEGKQYIGLPDGVGELTLQKFKDKIQDNLKLVDMFINDCRYCYVENANTAAKSTKNGMSVCFTGALNTMSRSQASKLAEEHGFEVKSGVSKGLTYLITNTPDSGSSKNKKAQQLGTKVITEEEFLNICNGTESDVMSL